MPDISMCINKKCPMKNNCYRFTAKPNEYSQSYSDFKPNFLTGECDDFIANGPQAIDKR